MKYQSLLFLVFISVLVSCKSTKKTFDSNNNSKTENKLERNDNSNTFYTEQVRNDFRAVSDSAKKKFLDGYNAADSKYSILFFTQGFNGENFEVTNNKDVIYKGSILTNKKTGLAKNMRVDNTTTIKIYDKETKKTIEINNNKAQKHKFIYLMKTNGTDNKYTITYSDKLRPEQ